MDRVTDARGVIAELPWGEVSRARIAGREPIARFEELLDAWPDARINVDPKHAADAEGFRKAVKTHTDFLRGTDPEGKDKKLRIDIFGLKKNGNTKPENQIAPLRPDLPALKPGHSYVVEVVLRMPCCWWLLT